MPRFELKGQVRLDGNKWKSGLDQAKRQADTWSSDTSKMIKSRLVSAFAVGAMFKGATAILDRAGQIRKDASRLDMTPEMFQHIESAAKRSRVEIDDVREAMLELSVKQQEVAKGSEDVTEAFQRFGLEFDDVVNAEPLELFKQISNAISAGENKENFIADLDTILSDDGKKLIDAFKNDFFGKVKESQDIGAPLSNQQVAEFAAAGQEVTKGKQRVSMGAGKALSEVTKLIKAYGPLIELGGREYAKGIGEVVRGITGDRSEVYSDLLNALTKQSEELKQINKNTAPLNQ